MTGPDWPLGPLEAAGRDHERNDYELTVADHLCGAGGWLYGGWALGLLTDAVQRVSGRRLHDLSVSFLRPVARHARLRVRCEVLASGRALAHVRAEALDDEGLALAGTAVVGPMPDRVEPSVAPALVAAAYECPERPYLMARGTGVSVLLDVRTAGERLDAGVASTMLLWGRVRCDISAEIRLAALSDHVPYLLRRAFPDLTRATTVSSSLRIVGGPVAEWVLLELSLLTLTGRAAVGRVNMWSAGTDLVAVAEQTTRLSRS